MTSFLDWLTSHRWLLDPERPFVTSADADGVMCGLLMSHALQWKCVGFYESEAGRFSFSVAPRTVEWNEAAFLDVEILRPDVRSIGNHLLTCDAADAAAVLSNAPYLASPNMARDIHVLPDFPRKYPFGTLPLLACALAGAGAAKFDERHLPALYFADSGLENAVEYKTNCLDWLRWMGAEDSASPLAPLCKLASHQTLYRALTMLDAFQKDAADAGFGPKQKALRFDPRSSENRGKAMAMASKIRARTGWNGFLPLDVAPVEVFEFLTHRLPITSIGSTRDSFAQARSVGALSMAAVGRGSVERGGGLSFTIPPRPAARIRDLW